MKRIIFFLTALLMCLCLAACGQKEPAAPSGPQLPAVEGCEAVLRVQFNPEFELYLDAEGRVLQVNCLNSDAQNAFADCDVAGMEIGAALDILLTAAWEQEYLTDERTVTITPVAVAENSAVQTAIDAIPQTVETIRTDLGGSFGITVNDAVIASAANTVDSGEYTVKEGKEDGFKVVKYYRSDGTLAERHEFRDGFTNIQIFHHDGRLVDARCIKDDGSFEQTFYGINGKVVAFNHSNFGGTLTDFPVNGGTLVTHYAEGKSTMLFRADGTLASHRTDSSKGVYWEYLYDANGMTTEKTYVFPRGQSVTTYENGVPVHISSQEDGRISEITCYPSGAPMFEEGIAEDGRSFCVWYTESTEFSDEGYPFGIRQKAEYTDSSGRLERIFYVNVAEYNQPIESFVYAPDGTVERHDVYTYRPDGNVATLTIRDNLDGCTSEHVFGADGSERITWLYDGCYPRIVEFDAAGNSTVIEEGGRRELHTTDENGNPLYIFWRKDGVREAHTTLPDGTVVSEYSIEVEVVHPDGSIWYQDHRCDVNGNIID